jgi:excisionase family DNA binding protein
MMQTEQRAVTPELERVFALLAERLTAHSARDFWLVPDLAREMGLGESTIHRELRAGRLPGRKVGDRWVIHRDALARWFQQPEALDASE